MTMPVRAAKSEDLAARLDRIEAKLDRVLPSDPEDDEDARLIREAWAEQGDEPLIPHEEVCRRINARRRRR